MEDIISAPDSPLIATRGTTSRSGPPTEAPQVSLRFIEALRAVSEESMQIEKTTPASWVRPERGTEPMLQ
jgi:hypothetical protein